MSTQEPGAVDMERLKLHAYQASLAIGNMLNLDGDAVFRASKVIERAMVVAYVKGRHAVSSACEECEGMSEACRNAGCRDLNSLSAEESA